MVEVARHKVAREGLANIDFRCMPAEKLDFPERSFNGVLCRFGLMFFDNPLASLQEMRRVLKPGGRLALSVWGLPAVNPTMSWYHRAFKGRISDDLLPPRDKITGFGDPEKVRGMLLEAGFANVEISLRETVFRFSSFEAFWQLLEDSAVLKAQFAALPKEEWSSIPADIASWAEAHRTADGLAIPHGYLLVTATK